MEDYQQRVVEEKQELDKKLKSLEAFIISPAFKKVNNVQCDLLEEQRFLMKDYSEVLSERIDDFNSPASDE